MANYIALINWTEKGIAAYRDTIARAEAANVLAGKFGGRLASVWWTIGPYDLVGLLEFPDDESFTAYALALGSLGNLRTTTMRAFDAAEMKTIVARAG